MNFQILLKKGWFIAVVFHLSIQLSYGNEKPDELPTRSFVINVQPVFNNESLVLSSRNYVSSAGDTLQIDRFRFYLSAFEIVFADGTTFKENNSYHLIDAEEDSTLLISLQNVPAGKIASIRFSIGVDSLKSVSGAFSGDLDPMHGMYWAWNSGYIHAKLEGRSKVCKTHQNGFEYHVGGFAYPENAIRKVELKTDFNNSGYFDGNTITLTADAQTWLNGISLSDQPSVVMPGKKAMAIADNYIKMFQLVF